MLHKLPTPATQDHLSGKSIPPEEKICIYIHSRRARKGNEKERETGDGKGGRDRQREIQKKEYSEKRKEVTNTETDKLAIETTPQTLSLGNEKILQVLHVLRLHHPTFLQLRSPSAPRVTSPPAVNQDSDPLRNQGCSRRPPGRFSRPGIEYI